MTKLKAIIIDDEQPARDLVKVFLDGKDEIELIGEAANGFEGAKLINDLTPDLVFLDIQMPKIDGFEMLELLEHSPKVIFCTAFDQYAIKAFDKNAVDYLLKPFSRSRFFEAVDKALEIGATNEKKDLPKVADYKEPLDRVVIKDRKEIIILDVEKINYLEAQDDYVEIHSSEGKWLKQETMKYFEKALSSKLFLRVHRKYIIKLEMLSKLDKMGKESYLAQLKDGTTIPVSLNGYNRLKDQLDL